MKNTTLQEQVSQNYKAFSGMKFNEEERGKFALLRDKKVIEIMKDRSDARKMGKHLYEDGLYSIQEIMPYRDFGYMSHAVC